MEGAEREGEEGTGRRSATCEKRKTRCHPHLEMLNSLYRELLLDLFMVSCGLGVKAWDGHGCVCGELG